MEKGTAKSVRALIQAAGLRATQQRVALLSHLRSSSRPTSADKIVRALRGSLNLTTVYRSLEQMVSAGLVRKVDLGARGASFEFSGAHHHHLICRQCDRVEDVTVCVQSPSRSTLARAGFAAVETHSLEFFGTCTACA